jgi:hypothetical protein
LLQPCEELRVAEVLGHWFEIGSPRLGDACEVSELMHRLRAQLEESMDHTVAEVAGLEAVAQEA